MYYGKCEIELTPTTTAQRPAAATHGEKARIGRATATDAILPIRTEEMIESDFIGDA